jgi:hypothetical protein
LLNSNLTFNPATDEFRQIDNKTKYFFNTPQMHREDSNTANSRQALLTQSPDARSRAHASWRVDLARSHNTALRRRFDKSLDAPIARRSSHTLRTLAASQV